MQQRKTMWISLVLILHTQFYIASVKVSCVPGDIITGEKTIGMKTMEMSGTGSLGKHARLNTSKWKAAGL